MYLKFLTNKFFYLFFFAVLTQFSLHSQQQVNNQRVYTISLQNDVEQRIGTVSFTAVLLRATTPIDFRAYKILIDNDTLSFIADAHSPNGFYQSNLLQFNGVRKDFSLYKDESEGVDVDLILIDGSYAKDRVDKVNEQRQFIGAACEPISTIISQSSWREGLPAPSYNRSYTTVENVIVHHSAGLNSVRDFRQAVRDIYLLHTEVNGWSDIGYNYLIAPDGSIFAGRDPLSGAQDNVVGAHFCGSNSNTMGICLLGNYQEVTPTDTIVSSLKHLLAWKINKETQLEALGVNSHPLNSNLNQIAGHRDGCNTACPGEFIYNRLQDLRTGVEGIISSCSSNEPSGPDPVDPNEEVIDLGLIDEPLRIPEYTLFPNPLNKESIFYCTISDAHLKQVESIQFLNQLGDKIQFDYKILADNRLRINVSKKVAPGIYYFTLLVKEDLIVKKILIL